MLCERYSPTFIEQHLLPLSAWTFFPPATDRTAWDGLLTHPLNQRRKAWVIDQANQLLDQPWPALSAARYMDYARNGNRSAYEEPYFQRRIRLATLVLAECIEGRGRFVDEIANGMWAMCDEATWCVPAHAEREADDPLPRLDRPTVDLFAAETAMVLGQSAWLLAGPLGRLSRTLLDRVSAQVLARVVAPVETRGDIRWFSGFNNWTPWCSANVLGAAFHLLDDAPRLARLSSRLMAPVDRFIDRYGDDGGCDEGPGYWGAAAGAMLLFLELLHSRTNGAVDVFGEAKVAAMGRYAVIARLHGPWVTNFADGRARSGVRRAITWRYGERCADPDLRNLALLGSRGFDPAGSVDPPLELHHASTSFTLLAPLGELFWMPADAVPAHVRHDRSAWLPDVQVLVARESDDSGAGLILAAKAGHNAESHNHNDVGQFIVMLDGQPCIVDVGVETYTALTFSGQRYTLWPIRGSAHNVPMVNGVEQQAGEQYRATQVSFVDNDTAPRLSMELAGCYPSEAGVRSLKRSLTLDRAGSRVLLDDAFELSAAGTLSIPLFTPLEAQVKPGCIVLAASPRPLLIEFDDKQWRPVVERVDLKDAWLAASWGDHLNRIRFETATPVARGSYRFAFRPGAAA
jgi:hypothetical protein